MSESITSAPSTEPAEASAVPQQSRDVRRSERLTSEIARLDRVLAMLVPVLAFVLASFVIHNSDYWLHLATGRALAEGTYTFGVDPFGFTTSNIYWVNHSWLYDWLLFQITNPAGGQNAGGAIIAVILKALSMALLAMILLAIRRRGQGWYASAVCVGLAVLAMAPGMTLQPAVVSLLFLGLTLFFLVRDGKPEPGGAKGVRVLFTASPRRLFVLPVLFAVWANLDGWFFLGPLTVALYLIGDKLQQALSPDLTGPDAPLPGESKALTLTLFVGLAACLLNPHHVHVFSNLPPELFAASRFWELRDDARFTGLFVTPVSSAYFLPGHGLNVCGMAYFPLLLGGVISFVLTRSHWRVWRLLIWTAFAGLSVTSVALVPFFAVVAGPIMALNFQDYSAGFHKGEPAPARRLLKLALATRLMTLLLAIILLAGAWPGWLQAHPGNPTLARRVGWGVEVNPSLRKAAERLEYWRLQGLLRDDDHGFNFSPDTAHYFAWSCPQEKGFFDSRYALFAGAASTYVDVRHMLAGTGRHAPGTVPDWQKHFRQHGITHVVMTGGGSHSADERTEGMVGRLLRDPQWTLLYLDGWTSIVGWNDPVKKTADRFAAMRYDPSREAFGPNPTLAPLQGPGRPPETRTWLAQYLAAAPQPNLDTGAAEMLLLYFPMAGDRRFPMAAAVGMFGAAGSPRGPLPSFASLITYRNLAPFVADSGPPGALPVAIRAARRAIAANPDDAEAYLALARTTEHLWLAQENQWTGTRLPEGIPPGQLAGLIRGKKPIPPAPWLLQSLSFRHVLRRVQELTALNQYLVLKPDNPVVHNYLFRIYWSMNYYDVAVDHLREQARLMHAAAGRANNPPEIETVLTECEKQLKELQREYEIAAAGKPPRVQAMGAFRPFGLPKQALAALLREDLSTLNADEASLVIYLHLTLGQADRLRGQFTEQQKAMIGPANFELLRTLASAAVGDYADADSHLAMAMEALPSPAGPPLLLMLQAMTFGQLQPVLLNRRMLVPFLYDQHMFGARQAVLAMQQIDELRIARGLLALEVGDVEKAVQYFRQAAAVPDPRYSFESLGIATRYLSLLSATNRQ
jgi:tetratricopeptide (TPR) repeat protein